MHSTPSIQVSFFRSETDTRPQVRDIAVTDLFDLLTQHAPRAHKRRGSLWSPFRFDGYRDGEHMIESALLAFDIDDGTSPFEVASWLEGLSFFLATTHSSTAEHWKLRVGIELTVPIPAAEFASAWHSAVEHLLHGHVDPSTHDLARMFYLPTHLPEVKPYALVSPGRPLDWHTLPKWEPPQRAPLPDLSSIEGLDAGQERARALGMQRKWCLEIANAPAGLRHGLIVKYGSLLGGLVGSGCLSQEDVEAELWDAALASGEVADHGERDVRRAIRDGLTYGLEREPWTPAQFGDSEAFLNAPRAKLTGSGSGSHHVRGTGTINGSAAQPPPGVGILDPIKWRSHRATLDFTPPAIDWSIDGVLGHGLITELVAKVKLGKTTFMLQGIRAGIAGDDEYCGRVVKPLRAAYVTEEGFQTFRMAMDRYGLNDLVDNDAFFTVFDFETQVVDPKKLNLPFVIDSLIRHAKEDRVDVVILDTLSVIASLDEEDHSGKAAGVMAEVRRLASEGFAVGILRHSRKSGGDVGDAGRGSSAISGYCDVLLQIEPYKGDEDSTNLRVMRSKSRLGVYEPLVLEFDKATERYAAVGDVKSGAERMAAAIQKTLASFSPPARDYDSARTGNEISLATKGRRTSILEELKAMAWRGDVKHAERGRSTVYWSPLLVNLSGDGVVPGEPEPSGTPEPEQIPIPPSGDGPEAIGSREISPPEEGIREPVTPKTRKPPTPEAVAKKAADKAEREAARLDAADAAAPTLAYQAVTETYQLPQHLAMLSTAACSLDTETTGLSAKHDRMRTVNLSDGVTHLVVDGWKITDWSPLQRYLDTVGEVRMHTYLFDLAFLATVGVTIDPSKVIDVRTMSVVLEAQEDWQDYTLQGIAKRHLAEHVAKTEQKRGWDAPVLRHAKLAYAAEDARVTYAAADALQAKLVADADAELLAHCLKLERDVQAATWWLASAGAPCDVPMLRDAIAEQETLIEDRLQELNAIADAPAGMNWRSPKQVLPILLARDLELDGTSVDHLMDAQSDDPIIDALLRYRSAGTCLGLLKKTLSAVALDGRVYASYNPIGAQTGRTSCNEPNLQQLPKQTRARSAFRPGPGRAFIRADYSQLQIVIAAWLSGDKNMQCILNSPGGDIHQATADAAGCSREQAKAINFGFLFGAGADTFRREQRKNGIVLSEEQAVAYRNTFFKQYSGIKRWHRSLGEWNTEAEVIDDTGSGRRRSRIFSNNVKANTPVQMAEAHGVKRALIALYDDRASAPSARLAMMIHDEVIVECDYEDRYAVAAWLKRHMVNSMQPLVDGVKVDVEVKIVESYSDEDKKRGEKV